VWGFRAKQTKEGGGKLPATSEPLPTNNTEPLSAECDHLAKTDPLLQPVFLAADHEQAEKNLSELITNHVEPVVRGVIHYKLHLNSHAAERAEAEDLSQEVLVDLLAELQKFEQRPETDAITDVRGLAAVIAHRACSRWMRRRFPERYALKNHLHYLLTRQKGFALWQNESQKMVAGFAIWQGQRLTAAKGLSDSLSDDESLLARVRLLQAGNRPNDSSEILAAVFNHLGAPIEFDELIAAFAALLDIKDQPVDSADQNTDAIARVAAGTGADVAWQTEKRFFLQRLWEEVKELPLNQRAALLLNLKGAEGRGCIALFPVAGIASVRELADTLGMNAEEFSELWSELPLEDTRIAERFSLTRQQVINARKSARERLKRRLRGFI
jgi:DNA-directed RNA polymerase specialized sigma24 family protein